MKYICKYCGKELSSKVNLNTHIEKAKYCLKLRGSEQTNKYLCICNKTFTSNHGLNYHKEKCIDMIKLNEETKYKQSIESYKQQLKEYKEQLEEYKLQIKDLQDKLENVDVKAVKRPTTTTNNTQNISLLPLTKSHMKNCSEYLTLDHIKEGALGYAKFALEHPFKDRLLCVDYARKKIKYKNSDGQYVTDPNLTKLAPKFFNSIEEQNNQLIDEIKEKSDSLYATSHDLEGWDLDDVEVEQATLNTLLAVMFEAKHNVRKASKNQDNNITNEFVKHVVSTMTT